MRCRLSCFVAGLVIFSSLSSCFSNKESDKDVKVIQPLKDTKIITDLAPYVEELELIPMSSDSVFLSGISKMLVTKNKYYVISGGVVFSMSKTGMNIKRVGNIGRGPGEYILLKDIALNLDGTELWCMDALNALLIFDVGNDTFLRRLDVANINLGYARSILPLKDNSFALYIPNPVSKDIVKDNVVFNCLRIFNREGRELEEQLPWNDFHINASFSVPVSFSDNKTYVLAPEASCPCIIYENGEEKEQVFFDFGSKNVPYRFAFRRGGDPMEMIGEIFEKDYFKLVSDVFFPKGDTYFHAFGKESSSWNFYIPNNESTGIRWKSVGLLTPPISAVATEEGYLFFVYEDYGQIAIEDEQDPLKRCVLDKYGVSSSSTSCLIKVKIHV